VSLLFPTVICLLDGTNICYKSWSGGLENSKSELFSPRVHNKAKYTEIWERNKFLNSPLCEAEKTNSVRIYQQFCDRNIELKNREDELRVTIRELQDKKEELRKTRLEESIPELKNKINNNINLADDFIVMDDVLIPQPQPHMTNNHLNENKVLNGESTLSSSVNEYTTDTIESS
jgi:uncharacterized protein with von Willebrand factor type A (vWA) domain